ncbi:MAG: dihydroneopterin aldolase [Flavobacteriales bacterium]|nr:dihydroneopterin aldolase [Flavobacteriales bacterium]
MGKIILEELVFYAYHGFYEFENKTGGEFKVDLEITLDFSEDIQDDRLEGTVNYEDLYKIVSNEMQIQSKLLEHVAFRIKKNIQETYTSITDIKVKIRKMNPPIKGRITSVGVEI